MGDGYLAIAPYPTTVQLVTLLIGNCAPVRDSQIFDCRAVCLRAMDVKDTMESLGIDGRYTYTGPLEGEGLAFDSEIALEVRSGSDVDHVAMD